MAVEDDPWFPTWKQRLENMIDAKETFRNGRATQAEIDKAQLEYGKTAAEI